MSARSYLYVPGDRPDRFAKAAASGADAVILDLEDAVPMARKHEARAAVAAWLRDRAGSNGPQLWVRVNAGELAAEDVRAVAGHAHGLSAPKATAAALDRLEVDIPVIALIETPEALLDVRTIAGHPLVVRLAIGEADLGAELGASSEEAFIALRMQVVVASAAAGIDRPVGPVSTDFRNLDALRAGTDRLRGLGFGARAAIHPAQVAPINEAFTPGAEEVERARSLLARFDAAGGGVLTDDHGRMVDEAVVRSARDVLARAGGFGDKLSKN